MELIQFYALNIFVGALLSIALGLFGAHVVARGKTLEVVLIGQSIQVGILVGVVVINYLFQTHDDHSFHPEIIVSLFFTFAIYSLYEKLTTRKKHTKTLVLVALYATLIAGSYIVVAASPLVESHMVKSYLGDIVTASGPELISVLLLTIFSLLYFWKRKKKFLMQSFDQSLFGHSLDSAKPSDNIIFNLIVLGLMLSSVHVLGIIFTLSMMILPIFVFQFGTFTLRQLNLVVVILSPICVLLGFVLNIRLESFPTSALITISYLYLAIIVSQIIKKRG